MKLNVLFETRGHGTPVYSLGRSVGLSDVDKIREDLGLPNLSIDVIDEDVCAVMSNIEIELTEEYARESGLFLDRNTAKVGVPRSALNIFTRDVVKVKRGQNGCITLARIKMEIDTDAVLNAWKNDGFPTEWNPLEK